MQAIGTTRRRALPTPREAFLLVTGICAALLGYGYYLEYVQVFSAGGAAAAGRQVWLQHLPPEKVPACGPDLLFMLENFPLADTVQRLIKGTGECAAVDWTFLGLSIAEWSLGWFLAFGAYALWLIFRNPGSEPELDHFPQVDGKYR